MPALSPTMETGSIAKWVKREGDQARARERRWQRAAAAETAFAP